MNNKQATFKRKLLAGKEQARDFQVVIEPYEFVDHAETRLGLTEREGWKTFLEESKMCSGEVRLEKNDVVLARSPGKKQ